ncbi:anion permease [Oscillatoria acuminata]|uniref:anion permease n=1 Tax=Oscillatoria acuminata TaxID=118323 RepID=UPI00031AF5D3|nr:anion permease [Oscillatoria acuminata]
MGILQNTTGQTISFAQWTLFVAPVLLVLLPLAFFVLQGVGQTEQVSLATARRFLEKRNQQLGQISRREIITAAIIVDAIATKAQCSCVL